MQKTITYIIPLTGNKVGKIILSDDVTEEDIEIIKEAADAIIKNQEEMA